MVEQLVGALPVPKSAVLQGPFEAMPKFDESGLKNGPRGGCDGVQWALETVGGNFDRGFSEPFVRHLLNECVFVADQLGGNEQPLFKVWVCSEGLEPWDKLESDAVSGEVQLGVARVAAILLS